MAYPFPNNKDSLWLAEAPAGRYPRLQSDIEVDVAIVGGGIVGMVTAYTLKQRGLTVAVLEQDTVASGTTGGTTGKLTSQHGITYSQLIKKFGESKARRYGKDYEQALRDIKAIIDAESLQCGFSEKDNYVYTTNPKKVAEFEQEAVDAERLGLPASFETQLDLPFAVSGVVKFSGQAQLDAYQLCSELARRIADKKSHVFEHTKALNIKEGSPCQVTTKHGSVAARSVVIATLIPPLPLMARVTYAVNEYPETSYIVAASTPSRLSGMYLSPDAGHYSLLSFTRNNKNYLLVGGESHVPGLGNAKKRQQKLIDYTQKWFSPHEVTNAWGAMDYLAYDGMPTIGRLYPWSKNMFTITGMKKWGIAGSMVGATVIADYIDGESTESMQLYNPHRFSAPLSIPKTIASLLAK